MFRQKILNSGVALALVAISSPVMAEQVSPQTKAFVAAAVDASFNAASACYAVQYLVFSAMEAKGRGFTKETAIAAAASRTTMRPELYAAIDLGYEVESVTDEKVEAFFKDCLNRTRTDIDRAILQ